MNAVYLMYEKILNEHVSDFYKKITTAAWEGCNSTKNMKPKYNINRNILYIIYISFL